MGATTSNATVDDQHSQPEEHPDSPILHPTATATAPTSDDNLAAQPPPPPPPTFNDLLTRLSTFLLGLPNLINSYTELNRRLTSLQESLEGLNAGLDNLSATVRSLMPAEHQAKYDEIVAQHPDDARGAREAWMRWLREQQQGTARFEFGRNRTVSVSSSSSNSEGSGSQTPRADSYNRPFFGGPSGRRTRGSEPLQNRQRSGGEGSSRPLFAFGGAGPSSSEGLGSQTARQGSDRPLFGSGEWPRVFGQDRPASDGVRPSTLGDGSYRPSFGGFGHPANSVFGSQAPQDGSYRPAFGGFGGGTVSSRSEGGSGSGSQARGGSRG